MSKEIICTGNSIDEAVEKGLLELNVTKEKCDIEVINDVKKSFLFGKIKEQARVKLTLKDMVKVSVSSKTNSTSEPSPVLKVERENNNAAKLKVAVDYVTDVLAKMNIDASLETQELEDSAIITIVGENLGLLIGRHGETLDSLQYLTSLVCNRIEGSYFRITIDCGSYRNKREDALQELARKISAKVKKSGRSQMLEPMNPYERRIIHAAVSEIDGVNSKSKGEEPNRRIIILSNSRPRPHGNHGGHSNNNRGRNNFDNRKKADFKPAAPRPAAKSEMTMEQILKGDLEQDTNKKTKLYSKVEL